MFGEGCDMNALMQQAQQMQEQMPKAQEELAARSFEGTAGGDLVSLTLTGQGQVENVTIKPEAVEDIETLQDLIVAAFRSAKDQMDQAVAEESKDVVAIERTNEFRGLCHVLGGSISPIDGRGPGDLHTRELFQRLADGEVQEVILATDPDTQGEATAAYLSRMLRDFGVRVTRPAGGVPVGGDLEYADQVTLGRAFSGRRPMFADVP